MDASTLIVGLDGSEACRRVLDFAARQAEAVGGGRLVVCYVIEWSPFSFQTAEENEQRHKRREEEIEVARERVLDPALSGLEAKGIEVEGIVRHGDVADTLVRLAKERGAAQIVIGRVGSRGLAERVFGGVSGRLVGNADVPVTIVP
jgi:nucleotide-binding universal stress UspA family protein